jgi:hypothetical protein
MGSGSGKLHLQLLCFQVDLIDPTSRSAQALELGRRDLATQHRGQPSHQAGMRRGTLHWRRLGPAGDDGQGGSGKDRLRRFYGLPGPSRQALE